jgi:hypothetical protein
MWQNQFPLPVLSIGQPVIPSAPLGIDIYSAAKKLKTRVLYDFANVEGFQQLSFVGNDLDFVTGAAGVFLTRPEMGLIPLEILKHQIN